MKKILIISFIVIVFSLTEVLAIENYDSYRVYAYGDRGIAKYGIKGIHGIDISDFLTYRPSMRLNIWGNETNDIYGGDGWLTGYGYLYHPRMQVHYSMWLKNITDCFDFTPTKIYCVGKGEFKLEFRNGTKIEKGINTFMFDLYNNIDGSIDRCDVAGDDLFNITGMKVTLRKKTISSGIQVEYSDFGNELNFPEPDYIDQIVYSGNNVRVINVGTLPLNVYVCGMNFSGKVEFRIKRGTYLGDFIELPDCNATMPPCCCDLINTQYGVLLNQFFGRSSPLFANQWAQMQTPRITYASEYEQGKLVFTVRMPSEDFVC